jgi:mono/diheme cytochrome c family protein
MLVSMLIFGVLVALVVWGHGQKIEPAAVEAVPQEGRANDTPSPSFYERCAHAGRDGRGANLDAPADPARPYPARPEWYFLFLFQLLKYFEGPQEIIGTVVIPQATGLLLALLPLAGYGRWRILGHLLGVLVIVALFAAVAALTCLAVADDMVYPLARAVLVNLATRAIPVIAILFLLYLGTLALLTRTRRAREGEQTRLRRNVSAIGLVILAVLLLGMALLAYAAMKSDQRFAEYERTRPEEPFSGNYIPEPVAAWLMSRMAPEEKASRQSAEKFREEVDRADHLAKRALQLASAGVPADGALSLLRRDPLTRGQELFGQYCAPCHNHGKEFQNEKSLASDLDGFGTPEWIRGLLREPSSPHYFGRTKLRTMSNWVTKLRARAQKEHEEPKLEADFDVVSRWLGSHPRRDPPEEEDQGPFAEGYRTFADRCTQCHTYKQTGGGDAKGPDFTGYGDADWLRMMIMVPYHSLRYGRNTMTAFRDLEGPASEITRQEVQQARELLLKDQLLTKHINEEDAQAQEVKTEIEAATKVVHLSDLDRELIIRWLLRDYRVVSP